MGIFSEKLDLLPQTAEAAAATDISALARHLRDSRSRHAIAIGSGGSAVAAEFLRLCRSTLGRGPTTVRTPLAFTMELSHLHDTDVWLFSASGDNHDILGALTAARNRAAKTITVVTSNPDARIVEAAEGIRDLLVAVTPRAEPKDGFLATHSLVGALVSLLMAAGAVAHEGQASEFGQSVIALTNARLGREARSNWADLLADAASAAVAIVLYDPRLEPAAVLLETSLWETAALPVQTTDFRNFAHGRHVWLANRADAFLLALTGAETQAIWSEIDSPCLPQ